MRLPIPKLNPNLTLTLFKKKFNPNPNHFLKENKKRHQNIGQHRVIFTGYLLRDGGAIMRGPYNRKSRSCSILVLRTQDVLLYIMELAPALKDDLFLHKLCILYQYQFGLGFCLSACKAYRQLTRYLIGFLTIYHIGNSLCQLAKARLILVSVHMVFHKVLF